MANTNFLALPLGFGFHPTDVELVCHYLKGKILGRVLEFEVIPEVDIYKHEPWELPEKFPFPVRNSTWYFLTSCDRKYPNGTRAKRATKRGYWKSTGQDRNINSQKCVVGTKKTLVFYKGRHPCGVRSPWKMHEYHLNKNECEAAPGMQDAFVLCRVFNEDDFDMEKEEVGSEKVEGIGCALEEDPCLAIGPVGQLEGAQRLDLEVAGSIPAYLTEKMEDPCFAFSSFNCQEQLEERSISELQNVALSSSELEAWLADMEKEEVGSEKVEGIDCEDQCLASILELQNVEADMKKEEVGSEKVEGIDCALEKDPCLAVGPVAQLEGAQRPDLEVAGSIPAYLTEKMEERSISELQNVKALSSSELEAWLADLSAPNSVNIPPPGELSYETKDNASSLTVKQDPAVAISCALPNTSEHSMFSNNPYPLHSELEDVEDQLWAPEFDVAKLLHELNFVWSPEFDSEKLLQELNVEDEDTSPNRPVNSDEVGGDICSPVFTGGNMQGNTRSTYNGEYEFVDDKEEKSNSVSSGLEDNSIGSGIQSRKRNRKSLNKVPNQRIRLQIHKMEARNVDLVEACTYEDQTVEFVASGRHLNSRSDRKSDSDQNFPDKSTSSEIFGKESCDVTKDLSKSEQPTASPVLDQTRFEIQKEPASGKLLQASFSEAKGSSGRPWKTVGASITQKYSETCNYNEKKWTQAIRWISLFIWKMFICRFELLVNGDSHDGQCCSGCPSARVVLLLGRSSESMASRLLLLTKL